MPPLRRSASPARPSYRQFLGAREVASRYGASRRTIAALGRVVRRHGLSARVDRSRVFARVRGSVRSFERLFGVHIRRQFDNDVFANGWFVTGRGPLRLPKDFRPLVREVVAAFSRSTRQDRVAPRGRLARRRLLAPANAGTWTGGCAAAQATGAYSFAQVRSAYGLDSVGTGAGASVAIVNVGEGIPAPRHRPRRQMLRAPGAVHAHAPHRRSGACLRPRLVRAAGGPCARARDGAGAELRDLQPGLACEPAVVPRARLKCWRPRGCPMLSRSPTGSASATCAESVRSGARVRARCCSTLCSCGWASRGSASFASAGDFGSTCNGQPFRGVTWPASSPYLTAVGGTRLVLDSANARADEVVWNDLEWLTSDNGGGAGGGGLSAVSRRPAYQRGLNVAGAKRAVPDLSAHASMLPGWPVVLAGNWVEDAGTSACGPAAGRRLRRAQRKRARRRTSAARTGQWSHVLTRDRAHRTRSSTWFPAPTATCPGCRRSARLPAMTGRADSVSRASTGSPSSLPPPAP